MKHTFCIKLVAWLTLLLMLGGCTKDDISSEGNGTYSTLTLRLPEVVDVGINTRSVSDENVINDLLVVLFQNGKAKYQSFTNPTVSGDKLSLTITDFSVNSGETLYVCCNTGTSSVTAVNADELAEQLTCTNSPTGMLMWGEVTANETTPLSIGLERVYAKATVTCSASGHSVSSWKVCNVPSQGYVANSKTGYPASTTFGETITPTNSAAYFIPRTDNNTTTDVKTYILVELTGQGWYKLDFYNGTSLDVTASVSLLDILRNTHYAFNITAVKIGGYATEAEAAANEGCNVVYDMEVVTGHAASNGQYSLILDSEDITLYPVGGIVTNIMEVLNISALIPNPENNISTYTVRLVNPGGNIDMIDSDDKKTKQINLNDPSKNLTTGNSARTVKLAFLTANVQGSYLEVCLGNIVKRVPIGVLSSNSYLMDFASATEQTMYIPIAQANMDGVERIAIGDALTPIIVWSDQDVASSDLEMIYDKDKQWIKITNKTAFSGNVVVAVTLNDVIKWSWHIWSMDNTVLTFNPKMNIYDFKPEHENEYNGFTFMDRNLGAYTLAKDGRISDWGLMYQFGRKDPFPGAQSGTPPLVEQTIYHNNQSFTLSGSHPVLGLCNVTSISSDNLEYSIQHPIRFIKGMVTGAGADWRTNDSSSDHYEWLTADREKAVYNPCPIGWTLPYGGYVGPWYGIHISHASISVNGLTFKDAGYYPFAPCREGENGTLNFQNIVSNSGLCLWWGNNNDDNISATDFRNNLIMTDIAPRSGGFHVRCVREK